MKCFVFHIKFQQLFKSHILLTPGMTSNMLRCVLMFALGLMMVNGNNRWVGQVGWVQPTHAWWDYNYGDGTSPFSKDVMKNRYPWKKTKRSLPPPAHDLNQLPLLMEEIAKVKFHIAKILV